MNTKAITLLLSSLFIASHSRAQAPDASGWHPMFDGQTLSGWTATPAGLWKVGAGGVIVGEGRPTVLFSPKTYTNFEIKAQVTVNRSGNSGIYFRAQPSSDEELGKKYAAADGYQAEIGANTEWLTGALGDGRGNIVDIPKQLVTEDTWFTLHIVAIGNRLAIKVNDTITVDYIDSKHRFKSGHIGLQVHHIGTRVMFRDVKVRPLPSDEQAATMAAMHDMTGLPFKAK